MSSISPVLPTSPRLTFFSFYPASNGFEFDFCQFRSVALFVSVNFSFPMLHMQCLMHIQLNQYFLQTSPELVQYPTLHQS